MSDKLSLVSSCYLLLHLTKIVFLGPNSTASACMLFLLVKSYMSKFSSIVGRMIGKGFSMADLGRSTNLYSYPWTYLMVKSKREETWLFWCPCKIPGNKRYKLTYLGCMLQKILNVTLIASSQGMHMWIAYLLKSPKMWSVEVSRSQSFYTSWGNIVMSKVKSFVHG